MDIQSSQHHLLKRFSPLKFSWPSCQKSADHRLVSVSGLLVLFLDLYVLPGPHSLGYHGFTGFALGKYDFSNFLFHNCCSGLLAIPFRISLSVSAPLPPLSQLGFLFYIDSVHQYGEYYHPHKGIEFSTNMVHEHGYQSI